MTITSMRYPSGRAWGIAALIAIALPLPWLFALNVLARVVLSQEGAQTSEAWVYGLIAVGGLIFFPVTFLVATVFAITAIRRPRRAGKVMGWIALSLVILGIPAIWFGYLVWISNS